MRPLLRGFPLQDRIGAMDVGRLLPERDRVHEHLVRLALPAEALLQRENDRMESLREQRSGGGYSEKFLSRRHFPIVDSPPVEEMDSPPDSPDEEAKKTLSF